MVWRRRLKVRLGEMIRGLKRCEFICEREMWSGPEFVVCTHNERSGDGFHRWKEGVTSLPQLTDWLTDYNIGPEHCWVWTLIMEPWLTGWICVVCVAWLMMSPDMKNELMRKSFNLVSLRPLWYSLWEFALEERAEWIGIKNTLAPANLPE